jgi:hypothetical protein
LRGLVLETTAQLLARLERVLGVLLDQLTECLKTDSPEEEAFAWDWELIQEAVEFESNSAVYGGMLWYGLRRSRSREDQGDDGRVMVAEGARRELYNYVTSVVREASSVQRDMDLHAQASVSKFEDTRLRDFAKHPDWKSVLPVLGKALVIQQRLRRLITILEDFAKPAPLSFRDIPDHGVEFFKSSVSRNRQRNTERNDEADAYNLATVEALRSTHTGTPVTLVTATRAVLAADASLTSNPFLFALKVELRKSYATPAARKDAVLTMIMGLAKHLLAIRSKLPSVSRSAASDSHDQTGPLKKGELNEILDVKRTVQDLQRALHEQPSMSALMGVLGSIQQSSRNIAEQLLLGKPADKSDLLIPPSEALNLKSLIQRLVSGYGPYAGDAPRAASLRIESRESLPDMPGKRLRVVDGHDRAIIDIEVGDAEITLSWPTEDTIEAFSRSTSHFFERTSPHEALTVAVRTLDNPKLLSDRVDAPQKALSTAARLAGKSRLSTIIISSSQATFWYEHDDHWARPDSSTNPVPCRVAVRFNAGVPIDAIEEYFGTTAMLWVIPSALGEVVKHLIPRSLG